LKAVTVAAQNSMMMTFLVPDRVRQSRKTISLIAGLALGTLGIAAEAASRVVPATETDTSASVSSKRDYTLLPQDLIRVHVFQEDDINKQGDVSISQESTITLPLIGTINLKGKTARQAEVIIRELYDRDYIVNPQVSVTVVRYAERSVNVLGAVNSAGRKLFPMERELTIVDAISIAGGHSRLADLRKVKLTRIGQNGEQESFTVNVDDMMKVGGAPALYLQPDDVVFIPERIL
jgi:polysaccharide export outer membrane protein